MAEGDIYRRQDAEGKGIKAAAKGRRKVATARSEHKQSKRKEIEAARVKKVRERMGRDGDGDGRRGMGKVGKCRAGLKGRFSRWNGTSASSDSSTRLQHSRVHVND
jgi:hypothetical protein